MGRGAGTAMVASVLATFIFIFISLIPQLAAATTHHHSKMHHLHWTVIRLSSNFQIQVNFPAFQSKYIINNHLVFGQWCLPEHPGGVEFLWRFYDSILRPDDYLSSWKFGVPLLQGVTYLCLVLMNENYNCTGGDQKCDSRLQNCGHCNCKWAVPRPFCTHQWRRHSHSQCDKQSEHRRHYTLVSML